MARPRGSTKQRGLSARAGRYLGWCRSILAPRERLLPGLGARLGVHPRLAASIFVLLRRLPGRRLRSAAYRNIARPLIQRMATALVVPVAEGYRLEVDTSDAVGRKLATAGVWEPEVTAAFRNLLSPGDVCVDIGAHVGYYTLLASRLVGPRGHVYALEPAPGPYEALLANLELNRVSNVTALRVAAGDADGTGVLEEASQSVQSVLVSAADAAPGSPGVIVRVLPVSAVVRPADVPRLRLVKIDVEGYELEVLRGLEAIFEQAPLSVLVEIHRAEDAAAVVADLCRRHGLKAYRIDDSGDDRRAPTGNALREVDPSLGLPHEHHNLLMTADRSLADVLVTAPRGLRRLTPALTPALVGAALFVAWLVKAVTLHDYDLI